MEKSPIQEQGQEKEIGLSKYSIPAIAGFILSIFSIIYALFFIPFLTFVTYVLVVLAFISSFVGGIDARQNRKKGAGLAIAGIIISFLVIFYCFWQWYRPVY